VGPHTITINAQDAVGNPSAPSVLNYSVGQATPTITWTTPAAITYGTALGAAQLDATASVPGTFAYTPAAGTVLGAGPQTLSVTFTPTDATDYTTATATVSMTVSQATPTITWATPAAITYGTALSAAQLDATASVPGTFLYSPAAGTVLGAGSQLLSVTFKPTDASDYSNATANVSLQVNKASSTITWATPAAITYGTALSSAQLDAVASVPGTFVYSPAAGTVLNVGSQPLSVSFTPTDAIDYSTATANVSLQVNPAASVITWPTPAPIPYGTALSAIQLDATANVPGNFVYTPAAGTVLAPGNQTLSVSFTPSSSNYTSASAQVMLQVTQTLISFRPGSVAFGTVKMKSVTSITVAVSNPGTAPLMISKIALKGKDEDNDLFKITNKCTSAVVPGGACSFVVTFSAEESGPFNMTLLVTDNVTGSPQQVPITADVVR